MPHTTALKLALLGAALTLLAIFAYDWLPDRTLRMVPGEDLEYYIYSDEMRGGNSRTEWVNYEELHWRCTIVAGVEYPYCGFHIYMGTRFDPPGLDLSRYHRVKINLTYRGDNNLLRFYVRNHLPGFSSNRSVETAQFNSYSVDSGRLLDDLTIKIRDFELARWWVDDHEVPPEYDQARFEHVIAFGVDLPSPVSLGTHEFRFNEIVFEGYKVSATSWYLGILLFWVVAIGGGAALRLAWLGTRRPQGPSAEQARQAALAQHTAAWQNDRLTGLLSRPGLNAYIDEEILSGRGGWPLGLLLVSLDQAGDLESEQGRATCDLALRETAAAIRAQFRHSDPVGRWEDDTFLILLPNTPLSEAFMLAEKLRGAIAEIRNPELPVEELTASIGVGEVWSSDAFHESQRLVDAALYRAKLQGRNRVVCQSG